MNFSLEMLYAGQENLLTLLSALIISQIFLKERIFEGYASSVFPHNKKLQLLVTSFFAGILPIDGRITLSIPLYKELAGTPKCQHHHGDYSCEQQKIGIVSYLATHHYYLWSPLEKSIIIIMAGLHFTYLQFLSYTAPLILVYILFLIYYVIQNVENEKESVESIPLKKPWAILPFLIGISAAFFWPTYYVFPVVAFYYLVMYPILPSLKIGLLVQVSAIIMLSRVLAANSSFILDYFKHADGAVLTVSLFAGTAFASFVLGSSSKYAGMITSICSIFGTALFPILFALDYAGYLLSPAHKCTVIAHRTFETPLIEFYKSVSVLAVLIILVGSLEYFLR